MCIYLRRITLGEERFEDVESEGEGLDGSDAGSQDDALYPQPDKGEEGAEAEVDVGVVSAGPLDHAAQLRVAVGACRVHKN